MDVDSELEELVKNIVKALGLYKGDVIVTHQGAGKICELIRPIVENDAKQKDLVQTALNMLRVSRWRAFNEVFEALQNNHASASSVEIAKKLLDGVVDEKEKSYFPPPTMPNNLYITGFPIPSGLFRRGLKLHFNSTVYQIEDIIPIPSEDAPMGACDLKLKKLFTGSSKGRTTGFDPVNGGSNPPPVASGDE